MSLTYSWDVDPLSFIDDVNASVEKITLEVSEEIFDGVVAKSPVDTGSFRAAWNVTVGQPQFVFARGGSSSNPLPPPKFPKLSLQAGQAVYITNGAPYAGALEDGHSGQAPNGMVAVTLAGLGK